MFNIKNIKNKFINFSSLLNFSTCSFPPHSSNKISLSSDFNSYKKYVFLIPQSNCSYKTRTQIADILKHHFSFNNIIYTNFLSETTDLLSRYHKENYNAILFVPDLEENKIMKYFGRREFVNYQLLTLHHYYQQKFYNNLVHQN